MPEPVRPETWMDRRKQWLTLSTVWLWETHNGWTAMLDGILGEFKASLRRRTRLNKSVMMARTMTEVDHKLMWTVIEPRLLYRA